MWVKLALCPSLRFVFFESGPVHFLDFSRHTWTDRDLHRWPVVCSVQGLGASWPFADLNPSGALPACPLTSTSYKFRLTYAHMRTLTHLHHAANGHAHTHFSPMSRIIRRAAAASAAQLRVLPVWGDHGAEGAEVILHGAGWVSEGEVCCAKEGRRRRCVCVLCVGACVCVCDGAGALSVV